jgi:hypothetical protein
MPYIAMIRDDIPDGTLQVLDLVPNTSLRNQVYDPPGQTKYVNRLQNDTVTVTSNVTAAEYKGLAAYIIDAVAHGGTGNALTATQANSMATAVIAVLDAGTAMTIGNVNTALQTVVALTQLAANNSVGTLADLLKILAGGEYVVPSGTAANSGGAFKGSKAGAFTTGQYRATYDSGALAISIGEGNLSVFTSADFEYDGTAGAALVVYDDDGSLLS